MKSLKALEDKYTLIREAVTPPTTATTTAPTTSAAPVAAPVAQSSILAPEELKSLTAAGIPVEPSKINAIVKDPQQLSDIINGLVASIAETSPEALKELLDAAKTNDSNKLNSVIAKYAKLTSAAPAATTGESAKLNEDVSEKLLAIADKVFGDTGAMAKVSDYVQKNPKKIATHLAFGALGAYTPIPYATVIFPVLVSALNAAIKRGGGGLKGALAVAGDILSPRDNAKNQPIKAQITDLVVWKKLKKLIINNNQPGKSRQPFASLGDVPDLVDYLKIKLDPLTVKKITVDDVPLFLSSPSKGAGTEQFQIKKVGGVYRLDLIYDGDNGAIWKSLANKAAPIRRPKKTAAADPAAAAAAKAKADEEEKMLGASYTPFTSLANKVLKEFYKNSKPLPIETANKK